MSGTAAAGALNVEGRDDRPGEPLDNLGHDGGERVILDDGAKEAAEEKSAHRLQARGLREALAALGPAKPTMVVIVNPGAGPFPSTAGGQEDRLTEAGEAPHLVVIPDLATTTLADIGTDGEALVRALAAADLARGGNIAAIGADVDLEPAPMIIERARAEQELGIVPAMPVAQHLNPLPSLAAGFALSLVAGVALYFAFAGG